MGALSRSYWNGWIYKSNLLNSVPSLTVASQGAIKLWVNKAKNRIFTCIKQSCAFCEVTDQNHGRYFCFFPAQLRALFWHKIRTYLIQIFGNFQKISPLVSDPGTVLLISFPSPSQVSVSASWSETRAPHTAFSSVWKPRGIAGRPGLLNTPREPVQKEELRSKCGVCVARVHAGVHKPVLSCSSCSYSC